MRYVHILTEETVILDEEKTTLISAFSNRKKALKALHKRLKTYNITRVLIDIEDYYVVEINKDNRVYSVSACVRKTAVQ